MALAQTLNEPIDPFSSVGRVARGGDVQGRGDIARRELEPMLRGQSAVKETSLLEEARLKREKAAAETKAEEDFAKEKKTAYESYQAGMESPPVFNPTQFDAGEAAKLAGLTAIITTVMGGVSGKAALKSMEGFTTGAREGRADLYDREVKQFEKDLAGWKERAGIAKERLTQVIDLLSTNKTAALVKAKELEPMLQDGLVKQKVMEGRYADGLKVLENAMKSADQMDIALSRAAGKTSGLKPGVDLVNKHLMKMRLSGYANQMQESLKDPEFAKKVDQYRTLAFLQEQNPAVDQLLQKNIPEDVRQFLILAKRFRNEVYRTESGLAVTAYEQLRQYGAVPQPGDSARALITKLQTLERGMRDDLANEQRVFPDLNIAAQRMGLAPVAPQAARQTSPQVERPQTQEDYDALPSGTLYIDPDDGKQYKKP